jgi:hypothetical protein
MLLGCQTEGFTRVRGEKQSHLAKERWQVNAGLIRASKFLEVTRLDYPIEKDSKAPRARNGNAIPAGLEVATVLF